MARQKIGILLLFFLCSITPVTAQDYIVNVQQFGIEEGLTNRNVGQVFKDNDGFLWLASLPSLQRFDGYEFKTFYTAEAGESINYIWQNDKDWLGLLNTLSGKITFVNRWSGKAISPNEKWGSELATAYDSLIIERKYYFKFIHDKIYLQHSEGIFSINPLTGEQKLELPTDKIQEKERFILRFIDTQNRFCNMK